MPFRYRRARRWDGPKGLASAVLILFAVGVLAVLLDDGSGSLEGRATAVDGDTIAIAGERIRLVGLDAPELAQSCRDPAGADWSCGQAARDHLSEILREGDASCTSEGRDRYRRILAHCAVRERDLGASMVSVGLAVAEAEYKVHELQARQARRGIWAGSFERPGDWRRDNGIGQSDFDPLAWLLGLFGT